MTKVIRVTELEQIKRCAPVLRELRTALTEEDIVGRAVEQMKQGYCLACLESENAVCSVAGYRVTENLAYGKFLYVDDLVTRADQKRNGFAGMLMNWLVEQAREQECAALVLDSGVQRFEAHRFYLGHRMDITSHHFFRKL
jgi:GNAT superfamily N-acetyltransferase